MGMKATSVKLDSLDAAGEASKPGSDERGTLTIKGLPGEFLHKRNRSKPPAPVRGTMGSGKHMRVQDLAQKRNHVWPRTQTTRSGVAAERARQAEESTHDLLFGGAVECKAQRRKTTNGDNAATTSHAQ